MLGYLPFSMIFTQERNTPRGTRFSALQATEQLWQPMQRRRSMSMPYLLEPVFFMIFPGQQSMFEKHLCLSVDSSIFQKTCLYFEGNFYLRAYTDGLTKVIERVEWEQSPSEAETKPRGVQVLENFWAD